MEDKFNTISRKMTEYIFYTLSMKYDADMKTNKLELYQIHSFPWKKMGSC